MDGNSKTDFKTRQLVILLTVLVWYYIGMFLFVTHFTVVYFLFANDAVAKSLFTVAYVLFMRSIGAVAEGLGETIGEYLETADERLKVHAIIAYLNGLYYYVFYFNLFTRINTMQTFIFLHLCDILVGKYFYLFICLINECIFLTALLFSSIRTKFSWIQFDKVSVRK